MSQAAAGVYSSRYLLPPSAQPPAPSRITSRAAAGAVDGAGASQPGGGERPGWGSEAAGPQRRTHSSGEPPEVTGWRLMFRPAADGSSGGGGGQVWSDTAPSDGFSVGLVTRYKSLESGPSIKC